MGKLEPQGHILHGATVQPPPQLFTYLFWQQCKLCLKAFAAPEGILYYSPLLAAAIMNQVFELAI